MKVIELDISKFREKWETARESMQISRSADPHLIGMTVQGVSGAGTPFKDEYDRDLYNLFNPEMPREITWYEPEGPVLYKIKIY
jgi:hypothetical protein